MSDDSSPVSVIRSARRLTLSLEVHPGGRAVLRAPARTSERDIQRFLLSSRDWLQEKQAAMREYPEKSRPDYREGGLHLFRGQQLRLVTGSSHEIHACPASSELRLPAGLTEAQRQQQLLRFYHQQCTELLDTALAFFRQHWQHWRRQPTQSCVRRMRASWGNCRSSGRITLNSMCCKLPPDLFDLVVLHELSHLQSMAHDRAFYQTLETLLPDHRERASRLREWEALCLIW